MDSAPVPPPDDSAELETVLFACLDAPDADRDAALADACKRHPELAERLQRCWQRIRQLQPGSGLPSQIAGHRILRRLGGGGMGVVYLAEQERLHRKVALKLIRSDLLDSKEARERFHREALAASRVEHPGLCPVFEVGEADGTPYMVMPYLEGITLGQRIAELAAKEGHPSSSMSSARRDLVTVLAAVARAAHHAHEQGLVHRDIKPGNIMLLANGRPMLLDFGLARDSRSDDPTLTRTGDRVGTPAYMAPEQLRGDGLAIDRRTDVYALGIVLYEVAMLDRPFASSDLLELREQVQTGIRPARLRKRVPYDLASIILKAAEPDPARRYQTAAELADDLERFARLEPVSARRLGMVARSVRWVRRHPVVSGLLFALAVALGLAGAALQTSLREGRRFESLALQGESRAAEHTDAELAVKKALAADALDPTSRSLMQLNRAVAAQRELHRWELGAWLFWVAFSPDKKQLFAATQTGSLHLFDVATHETVASLPATPDMGASCAAMAKDASFVVVGGRGAPPFQWRPATGERKVLGNAHRGTVAAVAVADDGTIYTGDKDGKVARWSADGELVAPFPWLECQWPVQEMRLRGETLVVACGGNGPRDGGLVIARTTGGTPVRTAQLGPCSILEFAPATQRIFVGTLGIDGLFDSEGQTARLPGARNRWFSGHLSLEGDRLAIGERGTVRLYDLKGAGLGVDNIANVPYRDCLVGDGPVTTVRFSADGQRMFAIAADNVLHVFDGQGAAMLQLPGFTKMVKGLDYDADSQTLATGDESGAVQLWDTRTCRTMPPEYQVPGACYNGLASDCTDPLIARRDNGQLVAFPRDGSAPWILEAGNYILQDARVSRDGRLLAVASRGGIASVWDLTTRQQVWASPVQFAIPPCGVDFLPGNRLLTVSSTKGDRPCEVQVWRIGQEEQEPEARFVVRQGWGRLNHGAATPDGRNVVIGSFVSGSGRMWVIPLDIAASPVTFGEPQEVEVGQTVIHIDIARSGDRLVAACGDNSARIYDLRGNLLAHCKGHGKRVEQVHFSPSGRWVVTSSQEGTARIWNAATGEPEMEVVVAAPSPVWDAVFSEDEKMLYTVSLDGLVRGWLLDRGKLRKLALATSPR